MPLTVSVIAILAGAAQIVFYRQIAEHVVKHPRAANRWLNKRHDVPRDFDRKVQRMAVFTTGLAFIAMGCFWLIQSG